MVKVWPLHRALVLIAALLSLAMDGGSTLAAGETGPDHGDKAASDKATLFLPVIDTARQPDTSCVQAIRAAQGDILGGEEAAEGRWPCMAALVFSFESDLYFGQFCGGTLIAPEWVLTAAHCVVHYGTQDIDIVLGKNLLAGGGGERIHAREFVVQPGYDPLSNDSDLALIRLAQPSRYAPVYLIDQADGRLTAAGTTAVAVGWGRAEHGYPYELRQVSIPVVSNRRCNAAWFGLVTENMVCAGNYMPQYQGTCFGDSGGPLFVRNGLGNGWVLAGTVSWGSDACKDNFGVYTRVSQFRDWIQSAVCSRDMSALICRGDDFEPDNSADAARTIQMGLFQERNFHVAGDSDWIKVAGRKGSQYIAAAQNLIETDGVRMEILGADGKTTAAADSVVRDAGSFTVFWTARRDEAYYVRLTSFAAGQHGLSTAYSLVVQLVSTQGDSFESDNGLGSARLVLADGSVETHDFHRAGDQDWLRFEVEAGVRYLLATAGVESDVDTVIALYDEGAIIASDDDGGIGAGSRIQWTAPHDGIFALQVYHYRGMTFGANTAYQLSIRALAAALSDSEADGATLYLPAIVE